MASPGAGAGEGGGGGAVINSEEFLKFQADQEKFATQHVELYMLGELAFKKRPTVSPALCRSQGPTL